NIVYADRDGNIGEHSTGLAPVREKWTGLLPVPGAGGFEWSGFVPNAELPHSYNPAAGFIVTANHKMIPENYGYKVGYEWAPGFRMRRISQVLSTGKSFGVEDMEKLQTDVLSLPAQQLIAFLRRAHARSPEAELLLKWDCVVERDSGAAALYEVWLKELTTALIERAAPEQVWKVLDDWSPAQVLHALSHPNAEVFGQDPVAGRDQLLRETLIQATERMVALQGADRSKWNWGKLHAVRFRHPLDQATQAKGLLDLGPASRPGDEYTVNATGYYGESFEQVSGASYREILDTSDWDQSVAVNAPAKRPTGEPTLFGFAAFVGPGQVLPSCLFESGSGESHHRPADVNAAVKRFRLQFTYEERSGYGFF